MIPGVDRSHLNEKVPLASLVSKGIKFIFFEAIKSNGQQDQLFNSSWQEAKAIDGLYRGAYAMFDPRKDGTEQAKQFLSLGINFSAPGCIGGCVDVEDLVVFTNGQVDTELTDEANKWVADNWSIAASRLHAFLNYFKEQTGLDCVIYTYNNYMREYYHSMPFSNNPMWLSSLQATCPVRYDTGTLPLFWQWSYNWENTDMDADYFTGTQEELNTLANIQTT
jgi:GH25 family lysozyme M1 (1,4-beta-N-acetylmuramidase)